MGRETEAQTQERLARDLSPFVAQPGPQASFSSRGGVAGSAGKLRQGLVPSEALLSAQCPGLPFLSSEPKLAQLWEQRPLGLSTLSR